MKAKLGDKLGINVELTSTCLKLSYLPINLTLFCPLMNIPHLWYVIRPLINHSHSSLEQHVPLGCNLDASFECTSFCTIFFPYLLHVNPKFFNNLYIEPN
ncbi:hypothetical protein CY35_11G003600 [Sphagnum magellanicum]|nr:hypothetical protein CY35_11G003600 [Sphagnum magellanicum]